MNFDSIRDQEYSPLDPRMLAQALGGKSGTFQSMPTRRWEFIGFISDDGDALAGLRIDLVDHDAPIEMWIS